MRLAKNNIISLGEYFKLRETNEGLMEFIDGIVYMSPPPSKTKYY